MIGIKTIKNNTVFKIIFNFLKIEILDVSAMQKIDVAELPLQRS